MIKMFKFPVIFQQFINLQIVYYYIPTLERASHLHKDTIAYHVSTTDLIFPCIRSVVAYATLNKEND